MPRRRKPDELKKKEGTYQPCRSVGDDVPVPILTDPADCPPPKTLTARQKKVWKEVIPRILMLGVVAPSDHDALVSYVQLLAKSDQLAETLEALPIVDEEGGKEHASIFRQWKSCQDMLRSIRKDFGLNPADRAGAPKKETADPDDPLSALLPSGKG